MSQFAFLFGDFHHYSFYVTLLLLVSFLNILKKIPPLSKARLIFLLFNLTAILFLLFRSIKNFIRDFILQNRHIIESCHSDITFCQYSDFLMISNAKWVHPNFSSHIIFIESIHFICSFQLIWLLFTLLQFYSSTHKL